MTIQMICSLSSPGEFLARGKEYDLPQARAVELLNAKFARGIPQKEKREKALMPAAETR